MPYKDPEIRRAKRKNNEVRNRAKTDRLFLANEILGYDFSPETHAELFAQYPEFKEGEPWASQFPKRDVLVLWPRGHFKTTAVMCVVAIQAILVFPDIRILIMQGSQKTTRERLAEVASHFLGTAHRSKLTQFFPEFCGIWSDTAKDYKITRKGLQLTKDSFVTPARERKQLAQATMTVASPKTVKTGQHFDLGIFDDLVNDQNYRSRTLLKKVQEDFDMCFPLVDPGCPRFVSGTRYAFGDLYEVIIKRSRDEEGKDRGEWAISLKTCWNDDNTVRFPRTVGRDGNSHGFTREILLQIMRDNPGIFASQYLNQPMLESQQILTKEDMLNATVLPALAPPLNPAVLFIDLAAEGDTEPDDHVIIIGKTDIRGTMYATGGNGGKWSIQQLAHKVCEYTLRARPMKVLIEETASAKYFVQFLHIVARDHYAGLNIPVDYIPVNNQKDAKQIRIKTMAGHVKNGRLKFFVGLPYWDKLVEQTTKYTGSKHQHDDYPDTLALMCNCFSGNILAMPTMRIPTTQHSVVAVLDRDVAMTSIDSLGKEYMTQEETMGAEFA